MKNLFIQRILKKQQTILKEQMEKLLMDKCNIIDEIQGLKSKFDEINIEVEKHREAQECLNNIIKSLND